MSGGGGELESLAFGTIPADSGLCHANPQGCVRVLGACKYSAQQEEGRAGDVQRERGKIHRRELLYVCVCGNGRNKRTETTEENNTRKEPREENNRKKNRQEMKSTWEVERHTSQCDSRTCVSAWIRQRERAWACGRADA